MTYGWRPEPGGSPPGHRSGAAHRRPDPAEPAGPRQRWQAGFEEPAGRHGAAAERPDRRRPPAPPPRRSRHAREPHEPGGYAHPGAPPADSYDPPPAGRRRAERASAAGPPPPPPPPPVRYGNPPDSRAGHPPARQPPRRMPLAPAAGPPSAPPAGLARNAPTTTRFRPQTATPPPASPAIPPGPAGPVVPPPPGGRPRIPQPAGRPAPPGGPVLRPVATGLTPPPPGRPDTTGAGLDSRWRAPRSRRWYALLAAAGVLAVLVTCGAFSYQLVQDELAGRNAQADSGEPSATVPRDISSREVDPEPLTVDEVFPTDEIVINPGEPPYQVLTTEASEDCSVAAADRLQSLLGDLGCSQVVRATFRSPTGDYLITGGVLNLATESGAAQAYDGIKPLVEEGTGRFLGLLAGDGTEPIVLSETVLFWDYRGHYLLYAVVARSDGEEFGAADNRYADLVSWDIVEVHLHGGVLAARATQPNPAATGSPASDEPATTPAASRPAGGRPAGGG